MKIASIHLGGRALVWRQSLLKSRDNGWRSWNEYNRAILIRFGAQPFDDPLAELIKLKQVSTVEQYQESFDALLNRIELPVKHAISCFLGGLSDEIQNAVRMFRPETLHDAYCLAKLQKATLASIARRSRPILEKPTPFGRGNSSLSRFLSQGNNYIGSKSFTRNTPLPS